MGNSIAMSHPFQHTVQLLATVSRRLFIVLTGLFLGALTVVFFFPEEHFVVSAVVITSGFIGGFVGLQQRLRHLDHEDLELIAASWIYTCLSPLIGGILAMLLYVLFLSELVSGNLFPDFVPDHIDAPAMTFSSVLNQHGSTYQDYAKLVFWSFLSGFSERFVLGVVKRFESTAVREFDPPEMHTRISLQTRADDPSI
jgi:hypothetical protein